MHDVMSFWLERGACGYRMDVINLISKDQDFPDAEPALGPDRKYQPGWKYFINGPRMHEYLQEINRKVLQKHGAITVGEMPAVSDINEIIRTVGSTSGELNMIFIFDVGLLSALLSPSQCCPSSYGLYYMIKTLSLDLINLLNLSHDTVPYIHEGGLTPRHANRLSTLIMCLVKCA